MKILKIILQSFVQFIMLIISVLAVYLAIVSWGAIIPSGGLDQNEDVEIFVQSNGVHTDICMPVKSAYFDWTSFIDTTLYSKNKSFEYIAVGWGDKGFFLDTPTWAELKTSTALAILILIGSIINLK